MRRLAGRSVVMIPTSAQLSAARPCTRCHLAAFRLSLTCTAKRCDQHFHTCRMEQLSTLGVPGLRV